MSTRAKCLLRSKQDLERKQQGFDGEHIARDTLKKMGFKDVTITNYRDPMDVLTKRTAWEIKTYNYGSKKRQMGIDAEQKKTKLDWCKTHKRKPKSMMILVNDKCEVFARDGLGKFRIGTMKRIRISDDWRSEIGHGRTERKYRKRKPKSKPMKEKE